MRQSGWRQSGPSLFFFTTWGTHTTASSAVLYCTDNLYCRIKLLDDHFFGFHFDLISFSSRLEDSSEQVKRELAGVVGQLSCLQSGTSHLSGIQSCSELFCQTLGLAPEHAGTSIPCLGASFVKPFLPLLAQQSPSSVKQGISYSASPFGAACVNDT